MSDAQAEGPEFFARMAVGYRGARALMIAVRRGVFDVLADGPRTAGDVARAMAWHPDATAQLLGALGALGVVAAEGDAFGNTALGARYLVRGGPEYMGHALRFADMLWDSWTHLEDTLRTGEPWRPLQDMLEVEDPSFTEQYIRGMQGLATGPAREVARLVGDDPGRSLLDVGCGPGAYSLAMLEAHPALRATLFDLAPTLKVARDVIGEHPAAARIDYAAGDYLCDDYGAGHDLALMSHVTHDEAPERVARMFRRARAALAPGGRLLVHDWVVDEGGCSPPFAALFSLHVRLYTRGGRVYRRSEYARMLTDAGFDVERVDVVSARSPNPTTLITARVPR